MQYAFDFVGL